MFADRRVGNSISVTVSGFSLTGSGAGNYSLTQPTLSADILRRASAPSPGGGSGPAPEDPETTTPRVDGVNEAIVTPGSTLTIKGINLDRVIRLSIDGIDMILTSKDSTSLSFVVPDSLTDGIKDVTVHYTNGSVKISYLFEVISNTQDASRKVNAGSFKGYVAIYARGYEGQRLSAKVGKDWIIINTIVNNQENGTLFRVTDFTGAGVEIAVRIYIDRVLIDTINLTTK